MCNQGELLAAARAIAMYLHCSTELQNTDLVYRPPSMALREEADAIDRKDAAIRRFTVALDACKDEQP